MIKIFGVSVWIHSIFILILGVLLLLYLNQGDVKEPFQTVLANNPSEGTQSTGGSGSTGMLGPGASATGAAYDLNLCVPGYKNNLGSGRFVGIYSVDEYTVADCPVIKIQMDTLKVMAQTHLESFQSTSLRDAQEQLCSLNISYMETGCNASNSIPQTGSDLLRSPAGSRNPLPIPINLITGSMTINTSEIRLSSSATSQIQIGSIIYLGNFPTTYIGPYYVTAINSAGTILTTSERNNVATANNTKVYWSPPLGRSNVPMRREGSNAIIRANLYDGYRYIVMEDTEIDLPGQVDDGLPLYISSCLLTAGPYIVNTKPTVERILLGNYLGSDTSKELAADGTYKGGSVIGGNLHTSLYTTPSPLSIKEVYLISGAQATAATTCKNNGGTVATSSQITIARQNGANLSEQATSAVCWGNRPPSSTPSLLPFSSTSSIDTVGVPYVASNPVSCIKGMFSRDGNCFECPAGHYCTENSTSPTSCPNGTFNPSPNMYSPSVCKPCPAGNICHPGAENPIPCPAGYFCEGGTNIRPCGPGFYSNTSGASQQSTCVSCPQGSYCPQTTENPMLCNSFAAIEHKQCPSGHYCPANSSTPTPCPSGRWSNTVGNETIDSCILCPLGTYCPTTGANTPTKCPIGNYCPVNGGIFPLPCPFDTYCPNKGMSSPLQICPVGYYLNFTSGSNGLTELPYVSINGTTKLPCTKFCPSGKLNVRGVDESDGTFCTTLCPIGYSCKEGEFYPQECPAGTYCPAGTTSPIICPPKTYCPVRTELPINCPGGTYCAYEGATSPSRCPTYFYCPMGTTEPVICPMGSHCPNDGMETPTICPPGTYCPMVGLGSAQACPAGSYCSSPGTVSPTICPAGTYCPASSVNPITCPRGSHCPTSGTTSPIICPPGKYCNNTGMIDTAACPAGSYCSSAGTLTPTICPRGTHCIAGSIRETACPAGTYCPNTGMINPVTCPPGKYCPILTITPIICPAGSYCPSGTGTPNPCAYPLYCNVGTAIPTDPPLSYMPDGRIEPYWSYVNGKYVMVGM